MDEISALIGGICGLALLWGLVSMIIGGTKGVIKTRARDRRWERMEPIVNSVIKELGRDGRRIPTDAANTLALASVMCRSGHYDTILDAINDMEHRARNDNNGRLSLGLQYGYELARRSLQHNGVANAQAWLAAAEHELKRR